MAKFTYYVYISFNADYSLYYIGSSKCVGDPLGHKYCGSGKAIRDGSFVPIGKFIWATYETRLEAAEAETELLKQADVGNNPFFVNKYITGANTHCDEAHSKMSESNKIAMNKPETKAKLSKAKQDENNPMFGKPAAKRDATIYAFIHKSGLAEYCTQYELYTKFALQQGNLRGVVNGWRKQHKGWQLDVCFLAN